MMGDATLKMMVDDTLLDMFKGVEVDGALWIMMILLLS